MHTYRKPKSIGIYPRVLVYNTFNMNITIDTLIITTFTDKLSSKTRVNIWWFFANWGSTGAAGEFAFFTFFGVFTIVSYLVLHFYVKEKRWSRGSTPVFLISRSILPSDSRWERAIGWSGDIEVARSVDYAGNPSLPYDTCICMVLNVASRVDSRLAHRKSCVGSRSCTNIYHVGALYLVWPKIIEILDLISHPLSLSLFRLITLGVIPGNKHTS